MWLKEDGSILFGRIGGGGERWTFAEGSCVKHGICLARWAGVARGTTASSEVQRVRVCVCLCACACVCWRSGCCCGIPGMNYLVCTTEGAVRSAKAARRALPLTWERQPAALRDSSRWKDPNLRSSPRPQEILSPFLYSGSFGSLSSPECCPWMCVMITIECGNT